MRSLYSAGFIFICLILLLVGITGYFNTNNNQIEYSSNEYPIIKTTLSSNNDIDNGRENDDSSPSNFPTHEKIGSNFVVKNVMGKIIGDGCILFSNKIHPNTMIDDYTKFSDMLVEMSEKRNVSLGYFSPIGYGISDNIRDKPVLAISNMIYFYGLTRFGKAVKVDSTTYSFAILGKNNKIPNMFTLNTNDVTNIGYSPFITEIDGILVAHIITFNPDIVLLMCNRKSIEGVEFPSVTN